MAQLHVTETITVTYTVEVDDSLVAGALHPETEVGSDAVLDLESSIGNASPVEYTSDMVRTSLSAYDTVTGNAVL